MCGIWRGVTVFVAQVCVVCAAWTYKVSRQTQSAPTSMDAAGVVTHPTICMSVCACNAARGCLHSSHELKNFDGQSRCAAVGGQ